jgi:hypothetical protein
MKNPAHRLHETRGTAQPPLNPGRFTSKHQPELDKEALGPLGRSAYLAVKRSEAAAFAAADAAFQYRQHLMKF